MKKINVNIHVLSLDGKAVKGPDQKPFDMKLNLSNYFAQSKVFTKDAVAQMNLARKIHGAKDEVEIENAEFEILKKGIAEMDSSALILEAYQLMIDAAEDLDKQSKKA